jgi:hypothetical protein
MLPTFAILSRLVGTLGIMVKVIPDVLTIVMLVVRALNSKGIDKTILTDKLDKDKEKIKNALNEPDPQKRSKLLNDVFSN